MHAPPRISIVTPVFNRSAGIARAIASVRRQTLPDFEHIVVDDGSTDGSADVAAALGDHRLRIERLPTRQGGNEARNRGVALSRAPIVTFLDSDDEFLPTRLERTLAILDEDPDVDVLLSSFMTCKGLNLTPSRNPEARLCPDLLERALASHAIFIGGTSITLRREAIDRCGGFADGIRRMQDRELLLRVARHQRRERRLGARLVGSIDWIKHVSDDSISSPVEGFVESLAALVDRHPVLVERYEPLVHYHVARLILAQLAKGRFRRARQLYAVNRATEAFALDPGRLASAYLRGRVARARIFLDIRKAARHAVSPPAAQPRPEQHEIRRAA